MQLPTRLSVILVSIVATAAIPLELEVDDGSALSNPLKKATADVNKQIPKMQQSLDDAAAGDAAAVERVRLAFGPKGVEQIPIIKENIARIDAGRMQVSSKVPGDVEQQWGPINAITPFDYRESAADPLNTYPVEFGKLFNSGSLKGKTNAATVLHEAAHVFAHASDDHYMTGTKDMVPLGLVPTADVQQQGGYAAEDPVVGSKKNPITDDRLSDNFKAVRDSATNMHMNADSYALFGAVCDEQMARRRKRALMENDPVAYYLAKRGATSCKLPPGYLKKKAAENAAKKKAASTSSSTSKAEVAKITNKNAAGVGLGSQKTTKGAKPPVVKKSTPKILGKATKSTRPETSKSGLSKGSLKGSKAKVPTTKTSKLSSKSPKGVIKGSISKVTTTKTSRASTRGKLSKARSSKLSSKTLKSGRAKASREKSSKAISKATRTKLPSKKPSKAISKKSGRPATSKAKASNPLSKTSKGKVSKAKTSKPLSGSSKSTHARSVKASASKTSPKKAIKSKASKFGSSRAAPKKGTNSKVTSANRSSPKKGAAGAVKKGGARGVKQTKKPSTRSQDSRGKQTSKQSSKLTGPKASKAKSSRATSAPQKATAAHPKAVRTKASIPAQKAIKAPAAPNKVPKALSKSVVTPLKAVTLPKKKNGKP